MHGFEILFYIKKQRTFCTLIAKAHGVLQLEIIGIMYHQSSMPGRVTGAQTTYVTFRKEDRRQGQVPWQTSPTSHFQTLNISKAELPFTALYVFSLPPFLSPPA